MPQYEINYNWLKGLVTTVYGSTFYSVLGDQVHTAAEYWLGRLVQPIYYKLSVGDRYLEYRHLYKCCPGSPNHPHCCQQNTYPI